MLSDPQQRAWILVSHSSHDLLQVRQVRNYLEEQGASPLLFHLLALAHRDEFWPVIEREIAARNFFLLCESPAATASEWVRRERAAVAALGKTRRIRVGRVRVDSPQLDLRALDAFLIETRVFPSYSMRDRLRVRPFLDALERAGFRVYREARDLPAAGDWASKAASELEAAAERGWVVVFWSVAASNSDWVALEIGRARGLGGRLVTVLLDDAPVPEGLGAEQLLDVSDDPALGPRRLTDTLLVREA